MCAPVTACSPAYPVIASAAKQSGAGWPVTACGPHKRQSRGRRPLAGVWGCPPAHKGRPEGIAPSGRRSGGCSPEPALQLQGESRGAQPLWRESEGVPQNLSFLYCSPFLLGRGLGGWSARTAGGYPQGAPLQWWMSRAPKRVSRGRCPLAGVWGCPPASKR